MPRLRIRVLGGLGIEGVEQTAFGSRKQRRLLARSAPRLLHQPAWQRLRAGIGVVRSGRVARTHRGGHQTRHRAAVDHGPRGDPVGVARRIREVSRSHGTWLLAEPFAGDTLEENLHPVGRLYYAVSTAVCTSHGVSQGDDECLGAQAVLGRLTESRTTPGSAECGWPCGHPSTSSWRSGPDPAPPRPTHSGMGFTSVSEGDQADARTTAACAEVLIPPEAALHSSADVPPLRPS